MENVQLDAKSGDNILYYIILGYVIFILCYVIFTLCRITSYHIISYFTNKSTSPSDGPKDRTTFKLFDRPDNHDHAPGAAHMARS